MTTPTSLAPTADLAERPYDVLISYCSQDLALAERLEQLLTARGKRVWRDKTRLNAGERVTNVIRGVLLETRTVVTIWSDAAAKSDWVKYETNYAEVVDKLATLSGPGFDYKNLPDIYRDLHCDSIEAALADPTKLLRRIDYLADPARAKRVRIDISRLPATYAARLFGREAEMADLNKAWDSAGAAKTNIVVLDAMGGIGKTALVHHFVAGLAAQGWRGAEAVFVWSFYSQGTDEKRQASADKFFEAALAWFGHAAEMPTSQHDKGVRLAELIAAKRALLVLDGLEPLQYGPARRSGGSGDAGLTGNLKDQGLRALLRQLGTSNPGLVVVTTRLRVPELAGLAAPAVITRKLGAIPTPAGIELLRAVGVIGPDRELEELVEELAGHAIALTQVATWLVNRRGGDVRAKDELPNLVDLGGADERHPFRVMQIHETQFKRDIAERLAAGDKPADIDAARQLALLFVMGLFDRPMQRGDREALLASPVIPGLTDGLVGLTRNQIDDAVESLRGLGLLLPWDKDTPDDIDAHPLVREYFGARLDKERPDAWLAAHGRLYDHYRFRNLPEAFHDPIAYALVADEAATPDFGARRTVDAILRGGGQNVSAENTPGTLICASTDQLRSAAGLIDGPDWKAALEAFLPETEGAMAPLFAAIAHGCAAGRHDEAFNEVYWPRIARGNEKFAVKKLGLLGSDLAAIAHFFAEPFAVPAPGLSAARQALVLNLAGAYLRALGRLAEAVEPMRAAVEAYKQLDNAREVALNASNLSELLATLGRLQDDAAKGEAGAVATAAQSVAYADSSGDAGMRMARRTTHADALLQAGSWGEAAARFAEAEAMQRQMQPGLPLLYSLPGYRCCDLKLAQGRAAEVAARAALTLQWGAQQYALHDRALDTLSLGRAAHLAAASPSPHASSAWGEGRGEGQTLAPAYAAAPHPNPLPVRTGRGDTSLPASAPHLDAAVDGLRAAGAVEFLMRGLLARAAYHRDAGNDKLASQDLTEAFEIAERGGMRLFLADCWLERARQHLAPANPAAAAFNAAAEAIERAAAIIAETGYHRRDPDLTLVRTQLALIRGDAAGARPHLDAVVAAMRAHDLWSFLPELVRLADRHALADLAPTIADLTEARARFDTAADAAFAEARKLPDGLDDDIIDARLADPEFRARLSATLVASGYKPLDETPIEEQRNDARQYIQQVERMQREDSAPGQSAPAAPSPSRGAEERRGSFFGSLVGWFMRRAT